MTGVSVEPPSAPPTSPPTGETDWTTLEVCARIHGLGLGLFGEILSAFVKYCRHLILSKFKIKTLTFIKIY